MQAALAAIVVVALKGLYLQVRDIYKYYRLSLADMVSVYVSVSSVQPVSCNLHLCPVFCMYMYTNLH